MTARMARLLLAAWVGVCAANAVAQVEWVTPLGDPAAPAPLMLQRAVAAPDGATFVVANVADGEATRLRVSRISAAGVEQWVRWPVNGSGVLGSWETTLPAVTHADGSVSLSYFRNTPYGYCAANYSATGDLRWLRCGGNAAAISLAADDDLYIVAGTPRQVSKLAATGQVRWEVTDTTYPSGNLVGHGIDSNGNYVELWSSTIRTWSYVDGSISAVNAASLPYQTPARDLRLITRSNRNLVVTRGLAYASNATTSTVTRHTSTGAQSWSTTVTFPGTFTGNEYDVLFPADADGVYVVRTSTGITDTQVAKLSAAGAVLWQRHYSRIHRIVEGPNGLIGIRSDVNVGSGSSDSFIFAIAPADGALGSPIIYSRSDAFAPTDWFAAANGRVIASFQGNNPFPPYAAFPNALLASSAYVGPAVASRWVVTALSRPAVSAQQSECLMPRLSRSSPAPGWWSRTQRAPQSPRSTWVNTDTATGIAGARSANDTGDVDCGSPITPDAARIAVNSYGQRLQKVNFNGDLIWQSASSLFPTSGSQRALTSIATSGAITYTTGNLLGRATISGTIIFETDLGMITPQFLAVDTDASVWVVGPNPNGGSVKVVKADASGALQWTLTIDAPSCSDTLRAVRLSAAGVLLVATEACSEGRVHRISANGQVVWQRVIGGTVAQPFVQVGALAEDTAGNVFVGACTHNGSLTADNARAASLVASWSGSGSERWNLRRDLFGDAPECVTSLDTDTDGSVYAASSVTRGTSPPVLWAIAASGSELWRHAGLLANPDATFTELALDSTGKLVALGEAPAGQDGPRAATLRRIALAGIGSPLRLKVLEAPATPVEYRASFGLRVGLRTAADVAANATSPVVVSLAVDNGGGSVSSAGCTIAVGSSECSITDARYDAVENNVVLSAAADRLAAAVAPAINVVRAATATTIAALTPPPYNAFSIITVRASVQGPPPPSPADIRGYLNGPQGSSAYTTNCGSVTGTGLVTGYQCDFLINSAAMPFNASFVAYGDSNYLSSTAAATTLPITAVTPALTVTEDTGNTRVAGDRVRFRVTLTTPGGVNVSTFVLRSLLSISGGGCIYTVANGSLSDNFSGSYVLCESLNPPVGPLSVMVSFAGNADLLAASTLAPTVTITGGAVLRGSAYLSGATVCSPTAGANCSGPTYVGASGSYEWACSVPAGASGQIFFVPPPGSPFVFQPSPIAFSNAAGVVNMSGPTSQFYQSYACMRDVDGDGATLAHTDGVLVLRRMFGLTGNALTEGATHACVPRSAAGIVQAVSLAAYDIDGDGQTRGETDGLLFLRAMLGFRGEALIADAIGANAMRRTPTEIWNFLVGSCGFAYSP